MTSVMKNGSRGELPGMGLEARLAQSGAVVVDGQGVEDQRMIS